MKKELVMYGRRYACGDQFRAQSYLQQKEVPYRFVDIGSDQDAARRLESWTGHLSVPTLVIAGEGQVLPIEEPAGLDKNRRVRGQDRGTLITEPSESQLEAFLRQHNLL